MFSFHLFSFLESDRLLLLKLGPVLSWNNIIFRAIETMCYEATSDESLPGFKSTIDWGWAAALKYKF